jgi:hypothetical protein
MSGMITDTDLARIYLTLEGVQLARELLADDENQTDGFDLDLLASILSECPPEKCLLVLACVAGNLCEYGTVDPALKLSLKMLSGDVLDDYAPLYLAYLKSKEKAPYEGQAIYMQEDLEAFASLFSLAGQLSPQESMQYQVCAVLADQAAAQAEFLDAAENDVDYALDVIEEEKPSLIIFSDNVIPFPGLFRKV